jgi:hypothetical protein
LEVVLARKPKYSFDRLPNDPTQLKEMLTQLKNRELQLEIDIALREVPELEEYVIRLMMLCEAVKIAKAQSLIIDKVPTNNRAALDAAERQLVFYSSRLEQCGTDESLKKTLQMKVDDLTSKIRSLKSEVSERVTQRTVAADFGDKLTRLKKIYDEAEPLFAKRNLCLRQMLPTLNSHLPE